MIVKPWSHGQRTGCMVLAAFASLSLCLGAADAQAPKRGRTTQAPAAAAAAPGCTETVFAQVVALDQAFFVNRFGALQAGGMMFALKSDVVSTEGGTIFNPGKVMVRADKRPRPLTLRVNKGQCLEIEFTNLLTPYPVIQKMATYDDPKKGSAPTVPPTGYQPNRQELVPSDEQPSDQNGDQHQPPTRYAGIHVAGMQWVSSSADDGTFVGANDVAGTAAPPALSGLIPPRSPVPPAGNVVPGGTITYRLYAAEEGPFLLTSGGATVGDRLGFGGQLMEGMFGSVMVEPPTAEYYRSQVTREDLDAATVGTTPAKQPIINYDAVYASGPKRGTPVLSMLDGRRGDARRQLISSDLTAIITGPNAGPFGAAPPQMPNQTYPEAQQPYREFAIHYHDDFMAIQAFKEFRFGGMQYTLQGGRDFFAINYGMGAIGASVWANRIQVGPANDCATCKFEEFFLSSWPNGDPAMVVDFPANSSDGPLPPPKHPATKAFYPDDPSNVYHSYLRDHVKFRILHAGTNITHVHHQHAHQWLHSPKSGVSAYRDSQMISPGAAYTLEMVYGGSGNKNLTMGDSIFHCHFYPHFAQGMWALWRVHDVFERGTALDPYGVALPGARALPDGEIANGTPIPAIVPLPTLAMAPMPAGVKIVNEPVKGTTGPRRNFVEVDQNDLAAGMQPGYPFFVPGIAGQRAPHPPMSYAPQLDASGKQVEIAGEKQTLDGGLPRSIVIADINKPYEQHNRWDFSKDSNALLAKQLEEEGTAVERAAMKIFSTRNHPSFTSAGTPATFVYNGQPSARGAPFANPAVHYDGSPVKFCEASSKDCNGKDFESRKVTYKGATIQTDVVFNKAGWHFPQQRMSVLWEDVKPTLDGKKRPEPLFMRVNSGDIIEFWLTNLIPNYYELDDFQVRTPTDIVGQHIHLVKFDVLASDGAANGWNYESGTLAAEEVRGLIGAINKGGGLLRPDGTNPRMLTAKTIPDFEKQFPKDDPLILGAQATVELWYADPLTDICLPGDQKEVCPQAGLDRTMGTVFTHDHFGPSTHQQAGLYAGVIIEPRTSQWLTTELKPMGGVDPATGKPVGGIDFETGQPRTDGGPTSWAAVIDDGNSRHREFLLEFQDRQLTYKATSRNKPIPYVRYQPATPGGLVSPTNPNGAWGWADPPNVINAPTGDEFSPTPQLVTITFGTGAWSLNYRNEPLDIRLIPHTGTQASDTAFSFASIQRNYGPVNIQPAAGTPIKPTQSAFDNSPMGHTEHTAAASPADHAAAAGQAQPTDHTVATPPASVAPAAGAAVAADPCAGADVVVQGDVNSSGPVWLVGGNALPVGGTVALKTGQLVCFAIKAGTHGLLFPDQQTAESVFDIANSPQKASFKTNPNPGGACSTTTTYGTAPQASGLIALLRVAKDAKLDKPANFECSLHCSRMAGVFTVSGGDDALSIAGDVVGGKAVWTVDGTILPNNGTVQLKKGQLVRFSVKTGTHGLLFQSQTAAEAVFDIASSPQASKFKTNPNPGGACSTATTYGTTPQAPGAGDNTIAELRVRADTTITSLPFECSQHCSNMAGTFAIGGGDEVISIAGDVIGGKPVWTVNGTTLPNNGTVPLKKGQLVRFSVKTGTHGLLFQTQTAAEAVFDIAGSPQASKFKTNPNPGGACSTTTTYGTTPQAAGTGDNTIADLRVRADTTVTTLPFECSQHCANMAGTFAIGGGQALSIAGDIVDGKPVWTVDGTTLPNNGTVQIKRGQLVRFSVKTGTHGLLFRSKAEAEAVFDIAKSPQAAKFKLDPRGPNTCSIANSYGTAPQAAGAGDNIIAELTVRNDATVSAPLAFECSQHCANMAGTFAFGLDIVGDFEDGRVMWKVNGTQLSNGHSVKLVPGQTVRFSVAKGGHGLLFPDETTAKALFDIDGSPQKAKFKLHPSKIIQGGTSPNSCQLPNSYGTDAQAAVQGGDNTIAELQVKQSFSLPAPGQWMCTQHCQAMQGLFVPDDTSFMVADTAKSEWLVDNQMLANNTAVALKAGRKTRVSATAAGDSLFFRDKAAPAALFENASGFTPMNRCGIDGIGLALKSNGGFDELTAKKTGVLSAAFMSAQKCQQMEGLFQPDVPAQPFAYPAPFPGAENFDPYTPLLRAYPGDTVEIRTLVGAHMAPHSFNMHGVKWLFEQNSPNSGFRSTQGMGISEYYHMRFEVPTTNAGADYLYATTSDTHALEYGQWGLLRAYDKAQDDLPPLGPPRKTVPVCPADAPVRSYEVSAVAASDALSERSGGYLIYNSRGKPFAQGAGQIASVLGLMYVRNDDLDASFKLKKDKPIEPLILRANAGDCIDVTVTNRIPDMPLPKRSGFGVFNNWEIYTSRHVSLHPQQVGMDIVTGNGVTIGKNRPQTVWKYGDKTQLKWFAGSIGADGTHTPVELGALGLSPADPLMQHPFGLLGALIIEPKGATWKEDANSRAQATVSGPSGKFREFVLVLQDDAQLGLIEEQGTSFARSQYPPTVTAVPDYSRAFNYRTEPLPYRYLDPDWDSTDKRLAPIGIARALSDSQVGSDPQTPVLAVGRGTPTRLRVVHPGGLTEQTFALNGHPWQEEPFRNFSRDIGDNGASQWFGGRDAFGANDQFNLVLDSAGGRNRVPGDYLYRSFIGTEFNFGLWGVMRVGETGRDMVTIARASSGTGGTGYHIAGTNTVNPDTGEMAKQVTISVMLKVPSSPTPVKNQPCTVSVDPLTGAWDSLSCSDAAQGTLIVDRNAPVVVQSAGGGSATVTGLIPAPALQPAEPRPSTAAVARSIEATKEKGQAKEIVQFRGERTPAATLAGPPTRGNPIPSGRPAQPGDQPRPNPSHP